MVRALPNPTFTGTHTLSSPCRSTGSRTPISGWAYTFATRTMTHNAVTKKWLVCDKGFVADWPTDGAITPFNSGGEVFPFLGELRSGLTTTTHWQRGTNGTGSIWPTVSSPTTGRNWYRGSGHAAGQLRRSACFQVAWGVYAYDIETNTCETVMHATWNDNTSVFQSRYRVSIPCQRQVSAVWLSRSQCRSISRRHRWAPGGMPTL